MLTGTILIRSLKTLFGHEQLIMTDISEVVQVSDLAENLGGSVVILHGEGFWILRIEAVKSDSE